MNLDPEPQRIVLQLILILGLTSINALFASAEIAVVYVNKSKIKSLAKDNHQKAIILEKIIENPSKFLKSIRAAITLIGIFSSVLFSMGIYQIISQNISMAYFQIITMIAITLILSYITVVFGELVPKRVALENTEKIALNSAKIIYITSEIMKPFIKVLSLSTSIVLKTMGYKNDNREEHVSEEKIRSLISQSEEQGSIDKDEKDMIEGVFEFNDKACKEIMTSRKDTYLIDIDDDINVYIDELLALPYTRIPIYEDNIDNIIGILHIKDLLIEAKNVGFKSIDIRKILKKPYFAPKTKKANELFKVMQSERIQMALLVDEYGGFSGIVTMEDLIEEIMGDIEDEYDRGEPYIVKIDENKYKVKANISIDDFNEEFCMNLESGNYDTLNGYIINLLGEIPKENEVREIIVDNILIKIDKINDKRIEDVIVIYEYGVKTNVS